MRARSTRNQRNLGAIARPIAEVGLTIGERRRSDHEEIDDAQRKKGPPGIRASLALRGSRTARAAFDHRAVQKVST